MSRRSGITKVEVLVVALILFILAGLLLPWTVQVRDGDSARSRSMNNLKQIALACHNYESTYGRLPPGITSGALPTGPWSTYTAAPWYGGQEIGLLSFLLPYIEQAPKEAELAQTAKPYWSLSPDTVAADAWFGGSYPPASYKSAQGRIPTYECPSDDGTRAKFILIGNFVTWNETNVVHTGYWYDDYIGAEIYYPLGKSNYAGVAGTGTGDSSYWSTWNGVFGIRTKLKLSQLAAADGTSNTLFIGEICGRRSGTPPSQTEDQFDANWVGSGAFNTVYGLDLTAFADFKKFSSFHTGIIQFAMGDGSVRALRPGNTSTIFSPDWLLLQQLAGYKDGLNADTGVLTN